MTAMTAMTSLTALGRARRWLLLAVIAAVLLTSSACVPGSVPGAGGNLTVTAYFSNTSGLFVGNDVGILGVTVGSVTSITPDGDRVRVELSVSPDHPIPADAGAVIVARSVATDRYVELTPVYDSGPKLADDAVIPEARTRTPVEFDDVLAALNRFATGISGSKQGTQALRRIIASGSKALDGRAPLLNTTIRQLAGALGSVSGQRDQLATTLRSLDVLVGAVARNRQVTRRFISQVARASSILDNQKVDLRTALRSFRSAVSTVSGFVHRHRRQVTRALNTSTDVLRIVLSRRRQLAEVIDVLPLALQNLQLASQGERIAVRVPPTYLLPLGQYLQQGCDMLPPALCQLLNGTDPTSPRTAVRGGHR